MRRIENISGQMQFGVDTLIGDIGEIDVMAGATFPCQDEQGEYLVGAYENTFKTVYSTGGTGEVNDGNNLGVGEGVFSSKTGVLLNFKSLVAGTGISLTSDANSITINNTGAVETITQVDFNDNSTEDITIGDITTDQNVKFEYVLEGGGNTQNGYMNIVTDGVNIDMDHQFTGTPAVVDEMNYIVLIIGNNIVIRLQSINVGSNLKIRYKTTKIDLFI